MINWESRYQNEGAIWAYVPSNTAETAARWFRQLDKKAVYIIGAGYGRNISTFLNYHFSVCGNDISATACQMGAKKFPRVPFVNGSYTETRIMPQEAIYCFNVIHCLEHEEQVLFIKKIYDDLLDDGVAYISVLSHVAQLSGEDLKGRTLFSELDLIQLCSNVPFKIESITPYTDMFYSNKGGVKQYPLLCVKLRK